MSKLRIALLRIMHESCTFCSWQSDIESFKNNGGLLLGSEILTHPERYDEVRGFLDVVTASDTNVEMVPLISADGWAGGAVSADAVQYFEENIRYSLRRAGKLDGVFFALHGAMASDHIPDLDGHFLEIVREEVGKTIPVVCTLDMHAIVTQKMVDLASAIVPYKTHPHDDVVETDYEESADYGNGSGGGGEHLIMVICKSDDDLTDTFSHLNNSGYDCFYKITSDNGK